MRSYVRRGTKWVGNTSRWWDIEDRWYRRWAAQGKRGKVSKEKK